MTTPQQADPAAEGADASEDSILCLRPQAIVPALPPIQSVDALLANTSLALPTELVHGLLHRGTKGVLAGSSKAGKTWLLLDLAVSVASGIPFLNWPTVRGKVLFINLEIQEAFFKQRLQTLLSKKGLTAIDQLDVLTLRGQETTADNVIDALIEKTREAQYSLIVIDPVYKLMEGTAENCSSGVGSLCQKIERLVVKSGAAVVYAHHFTKGNQANKKAMDRMSGSGVFARDADTIVTLTEHAVESCFVVEATLRNLPSPHPFVVEWTFPVMQARADLDPEDLQRKQGHDESRTAECLLQLLGQQQLTSAEWEAKAKHSGISRATYFRARKMLEVAGATCCDLSSHKWRRSGDPVSRETDETRETGDPAGQAADDSASLEGSAGSPISKEAPTPTSWVAPVDGKMAA